MKSYGATHCQLLKNSGATFDTLLAATYYDAEWVYYRIGDYTGDPSWYSCATAAEAVYRDRYVIPNNGAVPGYWNFTHGLALDFIRNGDSTSKNAVNLLATNAAYARDTTALSETVSADFSREVAYTIMAYLNAERLGAPRRARLSTMVDHALGHLNQWFGSKTAPYVRPFMVGLTAHALLSWYEVSGDSRVIPALTQAADVMWNTMWLPGSEAFMYTDRQTSSGGMEPAPDLNLLIAPMYGWLYHRTGDTRFRDRGDQVFAGGVKYAYLGGAKQFNQNYRVSFDYVAWRKAPPASGAVPTPTPAATSTPTPASTPQSTPLATATPSSTLLAPLSSVANWESRMKSYGNTHCNNLASSSLSFDTKLAATYYDAEFVFRQIGDYLKDSFWYGCATRAESVYRDQYVIANNGGVPGYWNFTQGLLQDYLATGDSTSKNAVNLLANNAAFAPDTTPLSSTVSADYSREVAYTIEAYLNAEELGAPRRARLKSLVDQAFGHLDQWFISKTAPYVRPFMVGLTAHALIVWYEKSGDPRVIPALTTALDWLWDHTWLPSSGAFMYTDRQTSSGGMEPAPDLNLLIAPAYGWLWHQTGTRRFIDRGDQIFTGGVNGASITGAKQFNQSYRWSFDFLKWRAARPLAAVN